MSTRSRPPPIPPAVEDDDPEFKALSTQQRKRIDKAFDSGLAIVSRRYATRKRRKGDDGKAISTVAERRTGAPEGEGGFTAGSEDGRFILEDEDDGGGFLPDDDAGGFMPEDGGFVPDDEEGGFLLSDNDADPVASTIGQLSEPLTLTKPKVPLHLIPQLLTTLSLPSDQDVLAVFQASAKGWEGPPSRKKRFNQPDGEDEELCVEIKDFRAVCAALMGPEEEGVEVEESADGAELDNEEEEEEDMGSDSEASDAFDPNSGDDSPLSSLSGSSYAGSSKARTTRQTRSKPQPTVKDKDFAVVSSSPSHARRSKKDRGLKASTGGTAKLNTRQKEIVKDIWEMIWGSLPDKAKKQGRNGTALGREEVRMLVRDLGEMWSEDEITEMVTLFSSQHEQRGLSYEDFGAVLLRAGLV